MLAVVGVVGVGVQNSAPLEFQVRLPGRDGVLPSHGTDASLRSCARSMSHASSKTFAVPPWSSAAARADLGTRKHLPLASRTLASYSSTERRCSRTSRRTAPSFAPSANFSQNRLPQPRRPARSLAKLPHDVVGVQNPIPPMIQPDRRSSRSGGFGHGCGGPKYHPPPSTR